jgi:hypothetical protein
MAPEDLQNANGQHEAIPPHCGPFAESAPFPKTTPGFVVVRFPQCPRSPEGRARARETIRQIIAEWADTPVSLCETDNGPEVHQLVCGHRIFLSLSYAAEDAWVAIALDQRVGLDAVAIGDCEGWEDIAPVYLGEKTTGFIEKSNAPRRAFAHQWAALEARCKYAKMPLHEKAVPPQVTIYSHSTGETVLAVAFEPKREISLTAK